MSLREYLFSDYLEDSEEVLFIAHRHFFMFVPDAFRVFIFHGALPVAFWYFFPQLLWLYAIWALVGIVRILLVIQDWYYDAWLITSMGIIGVEWTGYFDRTSSRVEYQSIEGVSYTIKGVIPTIFNYGNVTLAKLGGPSEVTLKDAYKPKRVEKNVVSAQEKHTTSRNFQDQEVLKQLLSDIVVDHIKKKGLPDSLKDREKAKESVKKE